ncbi:MAG: glycosyltransferase [Pseudomonadota bacterium]
MSKNYHIVLSRPFDLDKFDRDSAADACPRHAISMVRHALGAIVHKPEGREITLSDKIWAKIAGGCEPAHWAMARELAATLGSDDIVLTMGEDCGFSLAKRLVDRNRQGGAPGPRHILHLQNPDRPRSRLMLKQFKVGDAIDIYASGYPYKTEFIRQFLNVGEERTHLLSEQTDGKFFTPGQPSGDKKRPVIAGCGLEMRDYITLAQASGDMDMDVKICAVSPNATARKDTFPESIPDNIYVGYFDWPALRQLYRDADMVAIPLKPGNYHAGLTVMLEALACKRPVVMTDSGGLMRSFADKGLLVATPPQDPIAMKAAIQGVLDDPKAAQEMAERGYDHVMAHHTVEPFVENLASLVRG